MVPRPAASPSQVRFCARYRATGPTPAPSAEVHRAQPPLYVALDAGETDLALSASPGPTGAISRSNTTASVRTSGSTLAEVAAQVV